jgi:hypothetical protein
MPKVTIDGNTVEVAVIDTETYYSHEMVQIQATPEHMELTDQSGNPPWLFVEDERLDGITGVRA